MKRSIAFMCAVVLGAGALTGCSDKTSNLAEKLAEQAAKENSGDNADTSSQDNSGEVSDGDSSFDGIVVGYAEGNMPHFKIAEQEDRYYAYPNGQITWAAEYNLQSVMLLEQDREKYPELDAVLCAKTDELIARSDSECEKFIGEAKAAADANAKAGKSVEFYYVINEVSLVRGNDRYLGYFEDVKFNWNESRPDERYGCNYDVVTGQEVKLSDVLTISADELATVVGNKLAENYPDEADKLSGAKDALSELTLDGDNAYNWYFSFDGIHFVFNDNTLNKNEAIGIHEAVMGYDEGYIKDQYIYNAESGYCYLRRDIPLSSKDQYSGSTDKMELFYTDSEDSGFGETLTLAYKDQSATIEDYFDLECMQEVYDVVTAEGKEYIYVDFAGMDMDASRYVFEITGGTITAVGDTYFAFIEEGYAGNSRYAGEPVLTDPNEMIIGTQSSIFGSVDLMGTYKVGEDGIPVLIGDYLVETFNPDGATANKDVAGEIVSEDGTTSGSTTVPAGSNVKPYRTDNETYIDVMLEDGSMVRFSVRRADWSVWIGDETVDDLFSGLIYCG